MDTLIQPQAHFLAALSASSTNIPEDPPVNLGDPTEFGSSFISFYNSTAGIIYFGYSIGGGDTQIVFVLPPNVVPVLLPLEVPKGAQIKLASFSGTLNSGLVLVTLYG